MENKIEVVSETENKFHGSHIFMECMPLPEQCLIPNYRDYPDDKRIIKLEEILRDKCPRVYIVGGKNEDITELYRNVLLLYHQINAEYLHEDEGIEILVFKKIFWFRNKLSCKIFEDVYSHEKNELILKCYNRIFESAAGNNLCISLSDAWGMIDRLPFDMRHVANVGTKEWREFK